MQRLDALAAEDVQVIRAIEMLDTLRVLLAQFLRQTFLVFILEVKAGARKNRVLLDDLVQNVDVEGKALSTLKLLDELAADGAPNSVLVVQLLDAVRAQSVAAVDQNTGDSFTDVVLQSAELTDIQAARLVVQIHQVDVCHFASITEQL